MKAMLAYVLAMTAATFVMVCGLLYLFENYSAAIWSALIL